MSAFFPRFSRPVTTSILALFVGAVWMPVTASAESKRKNPASKLFVADVGGDAQIDTGDSVEDLSKRSVYTAQGTVVETKKPQSDAERDKAYSTMVFSNGTGAFFDADTRVELKSFVQEPFTPNRADIETEPSISNTQAFLARGAVGLCTSKMVAGSSMVYNTPQGAVNVRGRKVVIEAVGAVTKVSMLEGESTVKAGSMDMGGHTVHAGEQAIIRQGAPGQPNLIQIMRIPDNEAPKLDEKVSMACMAKKTVYFDVREKGESESSGDNSGGGVTAFDGDSDGDTPLRELVPIQVVPSPITIQPTLEASPSQRPSPTTRG